MPPAGAGAAAVEKVAVTHAPPASTTLQVVPEFGPVTMLQAAYMAVITFAGIGYEEIISTAHNPTLRLFNLVMISCGWLAMIYIVASVTAFLVEGEITDIFRRRRMQKNIDNLKYHYIVCGLGDTGRHAVEELEKTSATANPTPLWTSC